MVGQRGIVVIHQTAARSDVYLSLIHISLRLTMDTGTAWFFSRSRQKLWDKGETSGNFIYVSKILSDCDDDTLIYSGTPRGSVCHTGNRTCFYTTLWEKPE